MIVIKYGGHALPTPESDDPVLRAISHFHSSGKRVVLVHGGGPQVNAELAIHGIKSEMIGGYRPTTPEVFAVVQKVLSGDVLRSLVNKLISYGSNAVGLSAGDGEITRASKMYPLINGAPTDIGLVGDIESTNPKVLVSLLDAGVLPVISPVSVTRDGRGMNVNADIAAAAIGGSLQADQVIFMTDVAGIYREFPNPDSMIHEISASELESLQEGFAEGMIPKVKAALNALRSGAKSVRIIDGRESAHLIAALEGRGGTVVTP